MAGNGELMRSMRAGGGAGVAAVQELLRRAKAGAVSTAELKEVQTVISSPELRDAFKGVARDVSALLSSGTGRVFRDVSSLTPDTKRLTDARTLPERFLSDLKLVEQELLHHPGMTKEQKAARVFAFFESYAARFAELAHGTAQAERAAQGQPAQTKGAFSTVETGLQLAPSLTEAELDKTLAQFDKALKRAGFEALKTDDGRSGMEAARELLEAKTQEAQADARPRQLEAPSWKDNPAAGDRSLKADVDKERRAIAALDGKAPMQPHLRVATVKVEETPEAAKKKDRNSSGTDQVLGGQMLWNVMHLLRGDELDDVARRDAMNQLVVAAALILIFSGIVVGILVWM
ncbi:MAG: hypothetical protein Q8N23_00515 [Archangium sp.]|nr:hypothetical protein [Archangium sp.]MDP3151116.1 hypothetical protein [Archangium sp.]MDP3571800.1 hypothetical protein [Archangium sp.]